ncbi:hypothetical protein ILYODFUR_036994 [Ilyodon furcidens]|uniref:Uncharacterized protein n=1 Tax=Ilyodon furcidens TaxID=33524 RepID=A0ABV0T4Q2_9TELE
MHIKKKHGGLQKYVMVCSVTTIPVFFLCLVLVFTFNFYEFLFSLFPLGFPAVFIHIISPLNVSSSVQPPAVPSELQPATNQSPALCVAKILPSLLPDQHVSHGCRVPVSPTVPVTPYVL